MKYAIALLLAATVAACATYDQRPEPTTGGYEQGPQNSPDPNATQQPPDNYP